jgi:hypothetical protein
MAIKETSMRRQQISKKLRFDIFKRDGFICQYCGQTPPNVVLEIDHIIPVKSKGTNDINNLITACFDCNRGKGANNLNLIPEKLKDNIENIKEKEEQYKEYTKVLLKAQKRLNKEIDIVNLKYNEYFKKYELSEQFKKTSLTKFLKKIHYTEVVSAMENACIKFENQKNRNCQDNAIKYFCGICWNIIKEGE